MDKAEGDTFIKIKSVKENDGVSAYLILYRWFTDISGLGLSEQARRLMHPDPAKKEEDLADAIGQWSERVKRLEAHGTKYALAPLFKVAALRLMLVGRARDLFETWEAEHDTDEEEGFSELMAKVKDYARKKKLDHVATVSKDDMDCNKVGQNEQEDGWSWWDIDAVNKGKGKGKSGKGFTGVRFNCNEYGHSAKFRPKPKGKGKGKDNWSGPPTSSAQQWLNAAPKGEGQFVGQRFASN
jgi:hypothetical protein